MGIEVGLLALAATALSASTAYQVKSGMDASSARDQALADQNRNQAQAKKDAEAQTARSEQMQSDVLMKSKRQQGTREAMDYAGADAQGGAAGTMLTGPSGVDPSALSLGRSSLLGG